MTSGGVGRRSVFFRFFELAVGLFVEDLASFADLEVPSDRGGIFGLGIGGGVCSEGMEVGGEREVMSTDGERSRAVESSRLVAGSPDED